MTIFLRGFVQLCGVLDWLHRPLSGEVRGQLAGNVVHMKDPSSLYSQSLCVTGQWMLDLWELQGEDPKHHFCSLEETDDNCLWTPGILACVIRVQPHCSHLLPVF